MIKGVPMRESANRRMDFIDSINGMRKGQRRRRMAGESKGAANSSSSLLLANINALGVDKTCHVNSSMSTRLGAKPLAPPGWLRFCCQS